MDKKGGAGGFDATPMSKRGCLDKGCGEMPYRHSSANSLSALGGPMVALSWVWIKFA